MPPTFAIDALQGTGVAAGAWITYDFSCSPSFVIFSPLSGRIFAAGAFEHRLGCLLDKRCASIVNSVVKFRRNNWIGIKPFIRLRKRSFQF
jgi:hypothetical protein